MPAAMPGGLEAGGSGDGHGATPFTGRPVDSARPSAMFADWMAAPAVPFTRLSTAVTTTTRPARLVDREAHERGVRAEHVGGARELPGGQQLHEPLARVGVLPGGADCRGIRAGHDAVPSRWRGCRATSARCTGVNEIVGAAAPAQRSACVISGMCRCTPPTEYGFAEPRISLAEQVRLQALARARRADREHRDEVAVLDDAGADAGGERQGDGRGVAAGRGDAARSREPVALRARQPRQLGHAVGPGAVEVAAVERRPVGRALEAVVGAAVDDERVGVELGGDRSGCAVRQREEHDVVAGERLGRRLLQREVRVGAQVRLHGDERLAGVRVRRDGAHLEVGMVGEEAQDLPSGIAGRAGNGDGVRHGIHLRV